VKRKLWIVTLLLSFSMLGCNNEGMPTSGRSESLQDQARKAIGIIRKSIKTKEKVSKKDLRFLNTFFDKDAAGDDKLLMDRLAKLYRRYLLDFTIIQYDETSELQNEYIRKLDQIEEEIGQ